jgi:hypothetical protein
MGQVETKTGVSWLFGLVGTEAIAPECQHGLAYSETWQPWWSGLVQGLTLYLVSPWKAEWACAPAPTATASASR